jgi:hypothetical protein
MKISALTLAVAAILCVGALGAGQARATTHHTKTLNIVMRDPGCHWFRIHGKYRTTARVTGRVRLVNFDEAKLKVASRHGTRYIPVGKSIIVQHGKYVIMMVGQANDDNYLKLTVR